MSARPQTFEDAFRELHTVLRDARGLAVGLEAIVDRRPAADDGPWIDDLEDGVGGVTRFLRLALDEVDRWEPALHGGRALARG